MLPDADRHLWTVLSGWDDCGVSDDGACFSDGFGPHGNDESCVVRANVPLNATATYFDTEALEKRRILYLGSPPIIFVVSVAVHFWSKELFWTVVMPRSLEYHEQRSTQMTALPQVSYMAIYHFMAQNYGLLALYKARCGERNPIGE